MRRTEGQEVPFLRHLLLQPYAEYQARRGGISRASVQPLCPFCGEKPVVAALRPAGDGGKRSLICSLCSTEWDFRRLLCPRCGEEDQEELPIYTAERFPHVRVEACDSCHGYLKAVDLTSNGLAVPEVDELASLALDLWADEIRIRQVTDESVRVLGADEKAPIGSANNGLLAMLAVISAHTLR